MLQMVVDFLIDKADLCGKGFEVRLAQIFEERIHERFLIFTDALPQASELLFPPRDGQGCSAGKKGSHLSKAKLDFVHAFSLPSSKVLHSRQGFVKTNCLERFDDSLVQMGKDGARQLNRSIDINHAGDTPVGMGIADGDSDDDCRDPLFGKV
ncbi:hypothetical protein SDC9_106579 [bioreactor metagenome]|uniref:Uncharacterized protein n=1 Tax=bioreactor metagenome TaxID=1076179 RepID=A0A645B9D0_9ZZZZ